MGNKRVLWSSLAKTGKESIRKLSCLSSVTVFAFFPSGLWAVIVTCGWSLEKLVFSQVCGWGESWGGMARQKKKSEKVRWEVAALPCHILDLYKFLFWDWMSIDNYLFWKFHKRASVLFWRWDNLCIALNIGAHVQWHDGVYSCAS